MSVRKNNTDIKNNINYVLFFAIIFRIQSILHFYEMGMKYNAILFLWK